MALRVVEDAACIGCGLLCDDLRLAFDGNALVSVEPACSHGDHLIRQLAALRDDPPPAALIDGAPAPLDDALARCADLARSAKSPAVLSMAWLTIEAQREAVAIAEAMGASILPGKPPEATQRVGSISASWGEIRDRADIIVAWGADLAGNRSRLLERFIDPPGRFRPRGRPDRLVLAATGDPDSASSWADECLAIRTPAESLAALSALRALTAGLEPRPAEGLSEASLDTLRRWHGRLRDAEYGTLIAGPAAYGYEAELIHRLVRDLNGPKRFVHMALGRAGNAAGARAVLTWQSGYPCAVDFSGNAPAFRPAGLPGTADFQLLLGGDPIADADIAPTVHIGPFATRTDRPEAWRRAVVAIATATPGWDAPGTFLRSDGLSIPLKAAVTPGLPPGSETLRDLRSHLRAIEP